MPPPWAPLVLAPTCSLRAPVSAVRPFTQKGPGLLWSLGAALGEQKSKGEDRNEHWALLRALLGGLPGGGDRDLGSLAALGGWFCDQCRESLPMSSAPPPLQAAVLLHLIS